MPARVGNTDQTAIDAWIFWVFLLIDLYKISQNEMIVQDSGWLWHRLLMEWLAESQLGVFSVRDIYSPKIIREVDALAVSEVLFYADMSLDGGKRKCGSKDCRRDKNNQSECGCERHQCSDGVVIWTSREQEYETPQSQITSPFIRVPKFWSLSNIFESLSL